MSRLSEHNIALCQIYVCLSGCSAYFLFFLAFAYFPPFLFHCFPMRLTTVETRRPAECDAADRHADRSGVRDEVPHWNGLRPQTAGCTQGKGAGGRRWSTLMCVSDSFCGRVTEYNLSLSAIIPDIHSAVGFYLRNTWSWKWRDNTGLAPPWFSPNLSLVMLQNRAGWFLLVNNQLWRCDRIAGLFLPPLRCWLMPTSAARCLVSDLFRKTRLRLSTQRW